MKWVEPKVGKCPNCKDSEMIYWGGPTQLQRVSVYRDNQGRFCKDMLPGQQTHHFGGYYCVKCGTKFNEPDFE